MKEQRTEKALVTIKESRDRKGDEVIYYYNRNNEMIAEIRNDELIIFNKATKEERLYIASL